MSIGAPLFIMITTTLTHIAHTQGTSSSLLPPWCRCRGVRQWAIFEQNVEWRGTIAAFLRNFLRLAIFMQLSELLGFKCYALPSFSLEAFEWFKAAPSVGLFLRISWLRFVGSSFCPCFAHGVRYNGCLFCWWIIYLISEPLWFHPFRFDV